MAEAIGMDITPSLFQIRFKGCKGVVAIDPTLFGNQIVVRKSMNKFESEHGEIEVMSTSQPRKFYSETVVNICSLLSMLMHKHIVFIGYIIRMLGVQNCLTRTLLSCCT